MSIQHAPKKPPCGDWHPADIKAALEKSGWTLRRLSFHHGYKSGTTLKNALHKRWPKAQRLIAEALGLDPAVIWPSRYPAQHSAPPGGEPPRKTRRRIAS